MSNIGTLHPRNKDDFWRELRGTIRTVAFGAEINLRQNKLAQPNSNDPSHRVVVCTPQGEEIEAGAAWTKEIVRGPNAGDSFLSVSLDDPSFPTPLNFAVFRDEDVATATWRRRQPKSN